MVMLQSLLSLEINLTLPAPGMVPMSMVVAILDIVEFLATFIFGTVPSVLATSRNRTARWDV